MKFRKTKRGQIVLISFLLVYINKCQKKCHKCYKGKLILGLTVVEGKSQSNNSRFCI